jgi:predicted signal transduction protein with EAL and GGDEF domain
MGGLAGARPRQFQDPQRFAGHAVGDFLLREIGQRISHFAGRMRWWGAWSGDEFLLLQPGIKTTADAAHLARAMMDAVAQPITLDELPVSVSLSVGMAMFPSDGDRFDVLSAPSGRVRRKGARARAINSRTPA